MSISTNGFDPIEPNNDNGESPSIKKVKHGGGQQPDSTSQGNERPFENQAEPAISYQFFPLLDPKTDRSEHPIFAPLSGFKKILIVKFIMTLFRLISATGIIFFRTEIGLRMLPCWFFWLLGIAGIVASPILQSWWILGFTLLIISCSFIQIQTAYELSVLPIEERQHSFSPGTSMIWKALLRRDGTEREGFSLNFPIFTEQYERHTKRNYRKVKVISFDEQFIQRWLEPIAIFILAAYFFVLFLLAHALDLLILAGWFALTAVSIRVIETEKRDTAYHTSHDISDTEVEAHVQRIIRDNMKARISGENTPPLKKLGGLPKPSLTILTMRELMKERQMQEGKEQMRRFTEQ